MKYVRHTAAVLLVVAAIMGLGLLWKHSGAAGLVADDQGGGARIAHPISAQPGGTPPLKRRVGGPGTGGPDGRDAPGLFRLSNVGDLEQTLLIELGVLAGVVIIDRTRRRLRGGVVQARTRAR